MIENGKVIKDCGDKAVVSVNRKSMCGDCSGCAFKQGDKTVNISLDNKLSAEEGDTVMVEISEKEFLKSVVVAYLIPLISGATGLILGFILSTELVALLSFFIFTGFGYLLSKTIGNKILKRPQISKVVKSKEENK